MQSAIKDEKGGRALQNACKAVLKRGPSVANKRGAPDSVTPQTKRTKTNPFMAEAADLTPQELEKSLELPLCLDEEHISNSVIETNRAPLVLAFAVEVLRHTMPEQPLSSRLSLGQAVVSANSRSKAVSLGMNKGPSADEEGWGEGQPRVKVMGREIAVLKRGGYEWKGEEVVGEQDGKADTSKLNNASSSVSGTQTKTEETTPTQPASNKPPPKPTWATSQPITLKDSTFVARAIHMSDPAQRKSLIQALLADVPHLQTASHNAWAYRLRPPRDAFLAISRVHEESFDDGETGCGDLMLRVMRESGTADTLVILTRWFGGTMLGPDRWRLMRTCVSAALGERLRKTGAEVSLGGEALWGLDLEATRAGKTAVVGGYGSGVKMHAATGVVGMQIYRPEQARGYLLKSFGSAAAVAAPQPQGDATGKSPKKTKTLKALEAEKEENLGLLLGALRIVFDSWASHLGAAELDRRAWGW